MREWVDGWAVSRGTPAPLDEPWGWRIDVGLPGHTFRQVLPEADEPALRKLCATITTPGAWLKVCAPREAVEPFLTAGWSFDDPAFLMYTAFRPAPAPVPDGYTLTTETRGPVTDVRVIAHDSASLPAAASPGPAAARSSTR